MPQTGFKVGHNLKSYSWGKADYSDPWYGAKLNNGASIFGYNINQPNLYTDWAIKDATMNYCVSAVIKSDGTLWLCGDNWSHHLGNSTNGVATVYSPIQTSVGGTDWKQVSCGYYTTHAIKTDGTLWTWGKNNSYTLGISGLSSLVKGTPAQIGSASDWKFVCAGSGGSFAIKTDGTLWVWGDTSGYIGLGTSAIVYTPVQVDTDTTWKQISCGKEHSLAVKTDGTLWATGTNSSGQLGINSVILKTTFVQIGSATDWAYVSCKESYSSYAIKTNGSLWCWGENGYGELGISNNTNRSSPVQEVTLSSWKLVEAADGNAYAIKNDGTLWACGNNTYGQLAIGNTVSKNTFVQNIVGGDNWYKVITGAWYSSIAFKLDTSTTDASDIGDLLIPKSFFQSTGLYGWGQNQFGQLGLNDLTNRYSPTQISSLNWKKISSNSWYGSVAAIKDDGTLWTWGANTYGALGLSHVTDRSSPTQVGSSDTDSWKQISVGSPGFCIAIKTSGTLWAWGANSYGQLADVSVVHKSSPVQIITTKADWKSVYTSESFSIFMDLSGILYACGKNNKGQLGISTITNRSSPIAVTGGHTWKEVSCGYQHAVAIRIDGTLWAWGDNANYQLGLGNTTATIRSFPVQVSTSTDWSNIACSGYHTIAIKTDGTLWTCGTNEYGVLGISESTSAIRNTFVQVGVATNWKKIISDSGLNPSVAAIKTDGTLWTWGRNYEGQLGLSIADSYRTTPKQVGSDTNWKSITWVASQAALALKTLT